MIVAMHTCNTFDYKSYETCETCLLGKMTKIPFTGKSERSKELLGLIYIHVCRPMTIHLMGGYTYFIIFIDDHSRNGYIYL